MSKSYDEADLSRAFNQGHNDAWAKKPPRPAPSGVLTDALHQRYREGHREGVTARFWYDKGFEAGANQ